MKTVFSSQAQLCHVWAQQNQPTGRAAHMYFDNETIFSYGSHYPAARIHKIKGKRFALVRSDTYSITTSKHLGHIKRAVSGLMSYFCVSGFEAIADPNKAVKDLDKHIDGLFDVALKRKFFADSYFNSPDASIEIERHLESVSAAINEANTLRKLIGLKPVRVNAKKREAAHNHLLKLKDFYNSPERVAKRQTREAALQAKKDARETAQKEKQADAIAKFRAGKDYGSIDTDHELLRVRGSRVETSRGAIVPLNLAKQLLLCLKQHVDIRGRTIGNFTIEDVIHNYGDNKDTLIVAGCHRILLSEAVTVLEYN